MNRNTLRIFLVVVLFFAVSIAFAQTPPNRTPPPPPGSPIDGGILTLFAVAVGFAIKKLGFKNK